MLNPNQKLNKKIWDKDIGQVPIRKGFGEGLGRSSTDRYGADIACALHHSLCSIFLITNF